MLHRSEVVALINTLHRFSESLEAVDDFRMLWAATNAKESAKLVQEAEAVASIPARVCPHLKLLFNLMLIFNIAETFASCWLSTTTKKPVGGHPDVLAGLGRSV